jgi:hypothetical protein
VYGAIPLCAIDCVCHYVKNQRQMNAHGMFLRTVLHCGITYDYYDRTHWLTVVAML